MPREKVPNRVAVISNEKYKRLWKIQRFLGLELYRRPCIFRDPRTFVVESLGEMRKELFIKVFPSTRTLRRRSFRSEGGGVVLLYSFSKYSLIFLIIWYKRKHDGKNERCQFGYWREKRFNFRLRFFRDINFFFYFEVGPGFFFFFSSYRNKKVLWKFFRFCIFGISVILTFSHLLIVIVGVKRKVRRVLALLTGTLCHNSQFFRFSRNWMVN